VRHPFVSVCLLRFVGCMPSGPLYPRSNSYHKKLNRLFLQPLLGANSFKARTCKRQLCQRDRVRVDTCSCPALDQNSQFRSLSGRS
jgi:hypothetical protein